MCSLLPGPAGFGVPKGEHPTKGSGVVRLVKPPVGRGSSTLSNFKVKEKEDEKIGSFGKAVFCSSVGFVPLFVLCSVGVLGLSGVCELSILNVILF